MRIISDKKIMFQHVARHETSGLSIISYCKKYRIKVHNFYYWRKQFASQQIEEPATQSFIEIPMAPTFPSAHVQIRTPQGHILDFAVLPPVDYLRQLLLC